jgi:hypothetical protein
MAVAPLFLRRNALRLLRPAVYPPFAFKPISTRRRIASERVTPFAVAHASKLVMNSSESRKVREASLPVAGRPRLLGIAFFVDAFILMQYLK